MHEPTWNEPSGLMGSVAASSFARKVTALLPGTLLIVLCALLASSAFQLAEVRSLSTIYNLASLRLQGDLIQDEMATLKKCWMSADCGEVCIMTTCGLGYDGVPFSETREECLDRHKDEVTAWMKLCPEDE